MFAGQYLIRKFLLLDKVDTIASFLEKSQVLPNIALFLRSQVFASQLQYLRPHVVRETSQTLCHPRKGLPRSLVLALYSLHEGSQFGTGFLGPETGPSGADSVFTNLWVTAI